MLVGILLLIWIVGLTRRSYCIGAADGTVTVGRWWRYYGIGLAVVTICGALGGLTGDARRSVEEAVVIGALTTLLGAAIWWLVFGILGWLAGWAVKKFRSPRPSADSPKVEKTIPRRVQNVSQVPQLPKIIRTEVIVTKPAKVNILYLYQNGVVLGPFHATQITKMWENGGITMDVMYCEQGSNEWIPITKLMLEG